MLYILNKAADCLAILNYDVNFFLYCLCGSVFRRQLIAQCAGCWGHIKGVVTSNSSSSSSGSNKRASVMTMTTLHSVRSRSSTQSSPYHQSLMANGKRRETSSHSAPSAAAMRYSATCDLIDMAYGRRSPSPSPLCRRAPASSVPHSGGGGGGGGGVEKKHSLQHQHHHHHQQLQQETMPLSIDGRSSAAIFNRLGFEGTNCDLSLSSSAFVSQQT